MIKFGERLMERKKKEELIVEGDIEDAIESLEED